MGMPAGATPVGQGGSHQKGAIASGARRRLEPEGPPALVMGPRKPHPAGMLTITEIFPPILFIQTYDLSWI